MLNNSQVARLDAVRTPPWPQAEKKIVDYITKSKRRYSIEEVGHGAVDMAKGISVSCSGYWQWLRRAKIPSGLCPIKITKSAQPVLPGNCGLVDNEECVGYAANNSR